MCLPDGCPYNSHLPPFPPRTTTTTITATTQPRTARIGVAYSKGFQEGEDPRYLLGVITLKHWVAYNVETNRNGYNAKVEAYDLSDSYLTAFKAAVMEGRAAGVMW